MKIITLSVISCLVISALLYAFGSFVAASWDIQTWTTEGRLLIAVFWLVGSGTSVMALAQCHADD